MSGLFALIVGFLALVAALLVGLAALVAAAVFAVVLVWLVRIVVAGVWAGLRDLADQLKSLLAPEEGTGT